MSNFVTSTESWLAAVVEQRLQWDKVDKKFSTAFSGKYTSEDIWKLAANYRVARNFPKEIRSRFVKDFRCVKISSYDEFVRASRELARNVKNSGNGEVKTSRPLSGVSKLLWHRFPGHGFIYDELALKAVLRNGFVAPYVSSLEKWGGVSSDDPREWNFLIFAAAYQKYFWPLHHPLAEAMTRRGRMRRRQAHRVVDKLLWITGQQENKRRRILEERTKLATAQDRDIADIACAAAKKILGGSRGVALA
jgi:hypothetical protein